MNIKVNYKERKINIHNCVICLVTQKWEREILTILVKLLKIRKRIRRIFRKTKQGCKENLSFKYLH